MNKKPKSLRPLKAIKYLFKKPKTLRYPFELKEPSERYRGLHLNNWDKCTGCGNCADICPNVAIEMKEIPEIKPEEGEKNERPEVDYGRCCFCGLCVDICPTGSLRLSRDYLHIHFDPDTFKLLARDEKTDKEHFLPPEKYSIFKASLAHRKEDYEGFAPDLIYALFDPERIPMSQIPPGERKSSFIEQVKGFSQEEAQKEASRCLECKLCEEVCPAGMDIVDYVRNIWDDNLEGAIRDIYKTNPLPGICGRVCTHNCESACVLGHQGDPVSIRWLKRYAVDNIPLEKYQRVLGTQEIESIGKKIAIVGSGPGGLATAYYLRLMGYETVVFEKLPKPGGMMRYGIPEYRLPYEDMDKDIDYIKSTGVEIRCNTTIGKDIILKDLKEKYDAVFVSTGLHVGRTTGVPGTDHPDVFQAIEQLRKVTMGEEIKVTDKIVVIGGGDVAMDIARTLIRLQMQEFSRVDIAVSCLETRDIMPATPEEIEEALEEGIDLYPGWGPEEIIIEDAKITGVVMKKCLRVFDKEGRFNPEFDAHEKMELKGSMVVEAIGQGPDFTFLLGGIKEELEYEGRRIKINEYGQTSLPWLFLGGDLIGGPDVITAIDTGHKTAKGIDRFISKNE
ncbi:FAD-dependent oxidoreductase [candidate division WOR-3 bacterium]|nr:FAD-dependent oxidoreductase [candidate division WOR-3 bacterium]